MENIYFCEKELYNKFKKEEDIIEKDEIDKKGVIKEIGSILFYNPKTEEKKIFKNCFEIKKKKFLITKKNKKIKIKNEDKNEIIKKSIMKKKKKIRKREKTIIRCIERLN